MRFVRNLFSHLVRIDEVFLRDQFRAHFSDGVEFCLEGITTLRSGGIITEN
jgi:hypothetical protein